MDSSPLQQKYGRFFEPGEIIFEQNQTGDLMFIIQEGQVLISRTIGGRDVAMAVLEKGEFFGEMALVNRIPRTARAQAQSRTQLLAFDRAGLEQLVEKNPKIALSIIDRLCRRLGSANAQIQQLAQSGNHHTARVALLVMAQKDESLGTLQNLQKELGMTLQYPQKDVEDLVNQLLKDGMLECTNDIIRVGDRKRFQQWASQT